MRTQTVASILSLALAGCGGGDLTLPGPGEPATLRIVAGDGQQAEPGAMVPEALVVELLDGDGLPLEGHEVAFRFTDDVPEASVDPGSSATNGQGRVSARARLGLRPGEQGIEALVTTPGRDLEVRFELTALAEEQGGGDDEGEGAPPPPPAPTPPPGEGDDTDGGGDGESGGEGAGNGSGDNGNGGEDGGGNGDEGDGSGGGKDDDGDDDEKDDD